MVKLKGPGMATGASGQLAKTLIFSTNKGIAYAKAYATPAQPRSQGQVSVRAVTKLLSSDWSNFTQAQQDSWNELAARTDVSPFNACVGFNLRNWANFLFPSRVLPATRSGLPHLLDAATCVQKGRGILWTFTTSNARDGWALAIHHVPIIAGDATYKNCLQHMVLTAPGTVTWFWAPLPPGTYYFRIILTTTDGLGNLPGGQRTCVVT